MQGKLSDKDPTLGKFLKPQLSCKQPEIKRTYLQAAARGIQITAKRNELLLQRTNRTLTQRNSTITQPAQHKPPTYNIPPQMNIEDQATFPQAITDTFKNTDELFFGEEG